MEAVELTDKEIKYITLNRGLYLIDDKCVEIKEYTSKVQVDSFDNIKPITRNTIVNYYTTNGEDRLEVVDYNLQKEKLLLAKVYEDKDTCKWTSLEEEFAYRKFIASWKAVFKDIEVIGDPIRFSVINTILDTGNLFINSSFINGTSKDVTLFEYNRPSALLSIVSNCFTELGMVRQGDISYGATKNQKIWGNSTHSCIQYVTAFGTYIFSKTYESNVYIQKGELSKLIAQYETDKSNIENIIKSKYREHFGYIDEKKFNFVLLLDLLRTSKRNLTNVQPKQSTYSDYRSALAKLNEGITLLESSYEVK